MALTGQVSCCEWPWQDNCVVINGLDRTSELLRMALTRQLCCYEWPWQDKWVAANGLDRTIVLLRITLTGQASCCEWPWQDSCVVTNGLDRTSDFLRMALTGQLCYVITNDLYRTSELLRMALTGQLCCYEWPLQDKRVAANGLDRTIVLLRMAFTEQAISCYNPSHATLRWCSRLDFVGENESWLAAVLWFRADAQGWITFYSCLSAFCSWFNWTHIPNFSPSSNISVWNQ